MEEMQKAGIWEDAWSCHALSQQPPSQHLHVFANPEAPPTPSSGVFVEASYTANSD